MNSDLRVRIATRGSDLALWQANHVARRLEAAGAATEILVLQTRGDRIDDVPLHTLEGKAFFTSEIEGALLDGRADLAVHSHKDLPTELTPELVIAAVPERGPTAERLLVRPEAHAPDAACLALKPGAKVGTSSPRRAEQLLALRPDLEVADLRGNVPTRVGRLREGRYDAILLAAAGLERLQLDTSEFVDLTLAEGLLVPAPAQGALALQTRADDTALRSLCQRVFHHEDTARAIEAERSLLALAGGGCSLPLGAAVRRAGEAPDDPWSAHAFLGRDHPSPGHGPRWAVGTGDTPRAAVDAAYARIVSGAPTHAGVLAGLRIALCGSADGGTQVGARLSALGADVRHEQVIRFEDSACDELAERVARLAAGDVLAVTSRQAAQRLARPGLEVPAGVRIAAVGTGTAAALETAGLHAEVVGTVGARQLAARLELADGARVLYACAEQTTGELEAGLAQRGVALERAVLYRTLALDDAAAEPAERPDVRVFMSPSSVTATAERERAEASDHPLRIALGAQTAEELARHGLVAQLPGGTLPLTERLVHHLYRLVREPENAQ